MGGPSNPLDRCFAYPNPLGSLTSARVTDLDQNLPDFPQASRSDDDNDASESLESYQSSRVLSTFEYMGENGGLGSGASPVAEKVSEYERLMNIAPPVGEKECF